MKNVIEKACCRIDLSGGTLDLWPLYLYQGGLELVNMGIKVFATAKIQFKAQKTPGLKISISSRDLNTQTDYNDIASLADSLTKTTSQNPLRWVNRMVHHSLENKKLRGHIRIETSSDAPPGSGLGGSSVLGVALLRGMEKAFGKSSRTPAHLWQMQQTVRDLEAIEIEHPAGDQDYVAALFGGLNVVHLGVNSRRVERLSDSLAKKLSSHFALLYTGKPHHSGINNWSIFKAIHDGNAAVKTSLANIHTISANLAEEFRGKSITNLSALLNQEWHERCQLSPAVNAPVLEEAWAHAQSLGATARKGCGAGGGGCILFYFPSAELAKKAVLAALPNSSWKWLNAAASL